jgi:hypothetical protein
MDTTHLKNYPLRTVPSAHAIQICDSPTKKRPCGSRTKVTFIREVTQFVPEELAEIVLHYDGRLANPRVHSHPASERARRFLFCSWFFINFLEFLHIGSLWYWFYEIYGYTAAISPSLFSFGVLLRCLSFIIFSAITILRHEFVSSAPTWVNFKRLWDDYQHLTLYEVIVARGILEIAHMKFCVCLFILLFPLFVFVGVTGFYQSLGYWLNIIMGIIGFTTCFCGPWVVGNLCCWPWVSGKSFELMALAWTALQSGGDGLDAREVALIAQENSTIYGSLTKQAMFWYRFLANSNIEFYDLRSICVQAKPDSTLNNYIAFLFNGIHPARRTGTITHPLLFPRPESFLDCEENHRSS